MGQSTRLCKWCSSALPAEAHVNRRYCGESCLAEAKLAALREKGRRERAGRTCAHCGCLISDRRTRRARYCSDRCGRLANDAREQSQRDEERRLAGCEACGGPLPDRQPGERRRRFCSWRCYPSVGIKGALPPRECAECGGLIASPKHSSQTFCCAACRQRATIRNNTAKKRKARPHDGKRRLCARGSCRTEFEVGRPEQVYCSKTCQGAESGARHNARKRAQQPLGAEPYSSRDVFERDEWICGLCNSWVNSELRHPDPWSASIDHIIPLSSDGIDAWDNVQLAHLQCNQRKNRNRVERPTCQTLQLFPTPAGLLGIQPRVSEIVR